MKKCPSAVPAIYARVSSEQQAEAATIDAMGCQTAIAQAIVDAGADYVLAVKDNQPTLHRGISWFFLTKRESGFARTKVGR